MNIMAVFFGFLGFMFLLCVFGFCYGMTHPQKRSRTKTVITYNLDTHKFGVMYGFPDDSPDPPDAPIDDPPEE